MLLAVVASRLLSRITRVPVPLVQIALGAAIYYAGLGSVVLDPDVFFLLLLPPLLFLDGWRIPKDDLLREAPTVVTLALGLVVFTVIGVGWMVHWLIPALPLAVSFALAAVISPTDPIAVSAIAGRTPIPLRMRRILEGESLFNDASGLVCMRFAVAAALTGSFVLSSALLTFLWVATAGLGLGVGVAWALIKLRPRAAVLVGDDGGAQILVSLLMPFGAYLLAEVVGGSGILAAVAAGITMGFSPQSHWQAVTRIRRTAVWDTVQLAANGSIFVLLGEQIPAIVSTASETVRLTGHDNPGWLALYVVALVAALALLRLIWVWASLTVAFFGVPNYKAMRAATRWRVMVAMSVAGVRGVITLAAVLTLPIKLGDGTPFPGRDLAIFLAAGVIVLSLLLATFALPHALKGLVLPVDDTALADEHHARQLGAQAALRAIQDDHASTQATASTNAPGAGAADLEFRAQAAARVAAVYQQRIERYAQHDGTALPHADADDIERSVRLLALHAERHAIQRLAQAGGLQESTLRKLVRELDLQEARFTA
jgi:monovalent cation/hydrogen antiporter